MTEVMNTNSMVVFNTLNKETRTVSARELHDRLGVETRFNDWFPRMCEYGFSAENGDFLLVTQKRVSNNPKNPLVEITDYNISIDMAKEICMIQRNEAGKMFRRYFIEVEKQWSQVVMSPELGIGNALAKLLSLDVDSEQEKVLTANCTAVVENVRKMVVAHKEETEKLERQKREAEETIANQKMAIQTKLVPYCNQLVAKSERLQEENENLIDEVKTAKNDYDGLYNSFVSVEHWMMMKEVSDRLAIKKMGRNNLYKFLQEIRVLDSANRPYHHYVDMGYFKVADTIKRTGDWVRTYTYPMVSKKGLVFIEKMLRKHGYC